MTKTEFLRREAPRVLQFKLKAERTFRPEVKSYFRRVSAGVKAGGRDFPSIAPVYEKQYRRIANRLTGRRILSKQVDEDRIERALEAWILDRGTSVLADGTTEQDIELAYHQAREELGFDASDAALAIVAARIFRRLASRRITANVISETQAATEAFRSIITKQALSQLPDAIASNDAELARELADMSGDYVSRRVADGIEAGKDPVVLQRTVALARKQWVTMGDAKVRPEHRLANMQMVMVGEYFVVGGELLLYPGDTSMGASVWNVANCRCSSFVV